MKKVFTILIFIAFLFFNSLGFGQSKEGNIWYFGKNAGVDFNVSPPKALSNGSINTSEGCAAICNTYGNLLFYTDGSNVYNKTHVTMPNGTGLTGNISSTQSGIIVPHPTKGHLYFVFTTSGGGSQGLNYSVVDTTLAGGLGDITTKNVALLAKGTEKLNSVKHFNGKDTWVVSHERDSKDFYAYLVDANGVNTTPVISTFGSTFSSLSVGYLKFSPDGKKIVACHYFLGNPASLELFDFDAKTGVVSNAQTLVNNSINYYGAEFSPSGKYLYITITTGADVLLQYDVSLKNTSSIISSEKTIFNFTSPNWPGALQVGPDGKIYVAVVNSSFLGVINEPEKKGTTCDFVLNGLDITPGKSNFGLPSFNQSFFFKPNIDVQFSKPVCDSLNFAIYNTGDTLTITKSLWDFGDGTTDSGIRVYKTYQQQNVYTITNIVTTKVEGNVFVDTLTRTLTTKPLPLAKFGTALYNQCFNENYFEFRDSSQYFLTSRYKKNRWKLGANSPIFPNTKTIARKFNDPGIYDIELIVESDDGCFDTLVKQITIYPSPSASFTVQDSVQCFKGNKFAFAQQSTIDSTGSIGSYSWRFGDNSFSSIAQPFKNYADTGKFFIEMMAISTHGCRDTAWDTVSVLPSPTALFATTNVCLQDTTRFNNQSVSNSALGLSYVWDFGNSKTDTSAFPYMVYKDSGKFLVKLKVVNTAGCNDTGSKVIEIYSKPVARFETRGNCVGNAVDFIDNSLRFGAPTLNKWGWNTGAVASTSGNFSGVYSSWGKKTVWLVVKNRYGCTDSAAKELYINPLPIVKMGINNDKQCVKGNLFELENTSTIAAGGIANASWFFDNVLLAGLPAKVSKKYTKAGQYQIGLVAVSDSGCVDSVKRGVVVYPNSTVKVAINDTAQCFKGHRFVFANTSAVNGVGSIVRYSWLFGDNTTDTNATPTPKRFATEGVFSVRGIMETDKGCLDTFATTVRVLYSPTPAFDAEEICFGDSVFFDNTTPDAQVVRWLWNFGDGTFSALKNPYKKYAATGNYEVKLVATTDRGCKDTSTVYFPDLVRPAPKAFFVDSLLDSYERLSYYKFFNGSYGASDYVWDFGDGTMDNSVNPLKTYSDVGYFTVSLSATNSWGCKDVFTKRLYVEPEAYIYIPNAFTPDNDDTLNNRFKIDGIYFVHEIELSIYNRWGQLVFQSDKLGASWDGTYKGVPAPEGMYVYVLRMLDLKNKLQIKRGSVMLIR